MPDAAAQLSASKADTGKHMGVATCSSTVCHGSVKQLEARSVLQNEYVTWTNFDPHSRAYKILFDEKSTRMAKALGLRSASQAPECLNCHTDNVAPAMRGPKFQISDGIQCETCHGGAENWLATHDDAPTVDHLANVANGLIALERPVVRAAVCLDCHVGDTDRFASHRMMAAGHPRLSFELDTYTELWRTSGGREHYRLDGDYAVRKGKSQPPVTVWLTGLTAASRRSIDMIGWHTGKGMGALPDFALYNCYSCHRTMQLSGWSTNRDDGLAAGSVRLNDGYLRALLAVLDVADSRQAGVLRQSLTSLNAAVNGQGVNFATATNNVRRTLADIERRLPQTNWTNPQITAALEAITRAARRGTFADYAAAEQAAMAMVVLLSQLNAANVQAPEVDALFRSLEDDTSFDSSRFAQVLNLARSSKPDQKRAPAPAQR
jgi:hypothetical protein